MAGPFLLYLDSMKNGMSPRPGSLLHSSPHCHRRKGTETSLQLRLTTRSWKTFNMLPTKAPKRKHRPSILKFIPAPQNACWSLPQTYGWPLERTCSGWLPKVNIQIVISLSNAISQIFKDDLVPTSFGSFPTIPHGNEIHLSQVIIGPWQPGCA